MGLFRIRWFLALLLPLLASCGEGDDLATPPVVPSNKPPAASPASSSLPDPLVRADGQPVADAAAWPERRREILGLFEKVVYGKTPVTRPPVTFQVRSVSDDALGGKALRKQVTVRFGSDPKGPKMELLLYLPRGARKPAPVLLALNFRGNHTIHSDPGIFCEPAAAKTCGEESRCWPVEAILARGYGLATLWYHDLEPDAPDGLAKGIRPLFFEQGQKRPKPSDWGAIGVWAWGLSRAMDYLASDPDVDARHVAVLGHSRLGKTALWAGAQDERFAMVISNNSGYGGAALSRRRTGDTIARMNKAFPHWFCENFHQFNDHEDQLPVDQHMLLALIAPRPVYVASAAEDKGADPPGEFLSAKAADPVYRLLGTNGLAAAVMPGPEQPVFSTIGHHLRRGDHDITEYDWQRFMDFADRHFGKPGGPASPAVPESNRRAAQEILDGAGVQGGLIVHVNCGDGRLTAALRADDRYLVHGLARTAEDAEHARQHLRSLGRYGPVSVEAWSGGRLPYTDNLVNLVVADDPPGVSTEEMLRVLAPGGVTCVKQGGKWAKTVKPRPKETDEWTHFLHDASNNAVAQDTVVGPPRQLQWTSGPIWARSHDHLASTSALVSSGGRIFSIVDEGPAAAVVLQPRWSLVAQDAFNGVLLWKRTMSQWIWHLRGFRSGPSELAKRLVAVGPRVYVTLSLDGPLHALDAATGRTVATYPGTEGTQEITHHEGLLLLAASNAPADMAAAQTAPPSSRPGFTETRTQWPGYPEPTPPKRVIALDAANGQVLWTKSDAATAELMPTTLCAAGSRVFFQNAEAVHCLNARTGRPIWQSERQVSRRRPTWSAPTLVVSQDVVLSADGELPEKKKRATDQEPERVQWLVTSAASRSAPGDLVALRASDGKELWSCECREGYNSPVDVLVADGLVWTGSVNHDSDPGITQGRELHTGQIKRTRPSDQEFAAAGSIHSRCHRNKATSRYLLVSRAGSEFIHVATGDCLPQLLGPGAHASTA